MMKKTIIGAAVLAFAFSFPPKALPEEAVGSIKTVQGESFLVRQGKSMAAVPGGKIQVADVLHTGTDGSMGVILSDDAVLSIGPDSAVVIEEFLFVPAEEKLGFVGRIVKGTVTYLSGLIGKLAPQSVRFETPEATIGIRGTHFAAQVTADP